MSADDAPLFLCGHCKSIFRSGFSRCPADGTELQVLVDDPFVGQVFAGRYAIEALAGQGAMGRVYRARHTRMSKRFAVKIMFGDLASDSTMRARFQSEAEAASRLDHPHVVSVVDFGDTVGGLVYMVMDYVEGLSLARLIDQASGPMPEPRVRALLEQIALGLQHAHDRGLVHRDLKTDNVVVVESEGEELARVIDFGIAMFADAAPGPAKLTAVGVVIGTPAYMSPEQACGEKLDHRSDLFSLGIVAYEMLAGRKPFDGHPFEMARQNIASTPPPFHERAPLAIVSPELEAIVFRLMAKSREDRFPSAQALVEALRGHGAPLAEQLEPTLRLPAPTRGSSTARGPALARGASAVPAPRSASTTSPHPRGRTSELDLSAERAVERRSGSGALAWVAAGVLVVGAAVAATVWRDDAGADPTVSAAPLTPAPDPAPLAGTASQAVAPVAVVPPEAELDPSLGGMVLEPDVPAEPMGVEGSPPPAPAKTGRLRRVVDRSRARLTIEEADEPIGQSQLTARLRVVSARVETLGAQRGPAVAKKYQARMLRVTTLYNDALLDASKRKLAYDELEKLRIELERL